MLKKFIPLALLALSLTAPARAVIIGAEGGYLTDAQEEYLTARVGLQLANKNTLTHEIDLEIGYTQQKSAGAKADLIPLTVNYRFESTAANRLGYYFGAGAGYAFTEVSGYSLSDNDSSFAAQAFAGLSYRATDSIKLHLGLKYLWIDDVTLYSTSVEVGEDLALMGGLSIKF